MVLLWKTRRCARGSWEEESCFLSCGSAFLLHLVRTCLSTAIDFVFINLVKKIYDRVVAGKANIVPRCSRGTTSESDFSVNTARCGNAAVWFGFHSSGPLSGSQPFHCLSPELPFHCAPSGLSAPRKEAREGPAVTSLAGGHQGRTLGRTACSRFIMDWLWIFFLHPVSFYQGAAFPFALLFNHLCTVDSFSTRAR